MTDAVYDEIKDHRCTCPDDSGSCEWCLLYYDVYGRDDTLPQAPEQPALWDWLLVLGAIVFFAVWILRGCM
jgi:hypothetical protein